MATSPMTWRDDQLAEHAGPAAGTVDAALALAAELAPIASCLATGGGP